MYYDLPAPIVCGMCGALAGLVGGACNSCFPVWVGAITGGSLGCLLCIVHAIIPEPPQPPVALRAPVSVRTPEPMIVQNIYITYVSGDSKELPVAKVVEN